MVEQETKKGYGKRPLWQWIVVYLIIGIIVYGLIYYFVLAKKEAYNYPTRTYTSPPIQASSPTPQTTASPTQTSKPTPTVSPSTTNQQMQPKTPSYNYNY